MRFESEVCSVMCDRCVIVLVLLPPGGSVLLLVELVKEKKKHQALIQSVIKSI